jgi:hypothetical protein
MRFTAIRHENGSWLVMDSKNNAPKVICSCKGHEAVFNAAHIVDALEAYHRSLMDAVLPSGTQEGKDNGS